MPQAIQKISGVVRNYDWGGYTYIPAFLGDCEPPKAPSAEYWLGVHPSAPAVVIEGEEAGKNLIQLQEELGDAPLSFLMKILDVRQMLSIQVHPSIEEAEAGFAAEEAAGIGITAPNRTYKDKNHKPELAYALGEFWMLHGLRDVDDIRDDLASRDYTKPLLDILDSDGLAGLVAASVDEENTVIKQAAGSLIEDAFNKAGKSPKSSPDFWVHRWLEANPGVTRGILMILLMNLVEMKAGDAIYQPQGLIHAYLEGRNVEIMANSDNVLRAGLTSKHIDAEELVKISNLDSTNPNDYIVRVERNEDGIRSFDTPYEDFLLRDIEIPVNGSRELKWEKAQILVFFSGEELEVSANGTSLHLCQGESAFCRPSETITLTNSSQRTAHLFIGS